MFLAESEIKYTINNCNNRKILNWLKSRCKVDTAFHAQTVSSIYYDTWNWKLLNEKINSDYLKKKIRFRWYSDISCRQHHEPSFAEAKFRIGTKRTKVRIPTPYSGDKAAQTPLHHPLFMQIPNLLEANGVILGEKYFPVYQISYKRIRFKEPRTGASVCFDYDIRAPRINTFMLPNAYPSTLHTAVLELKGPVEELPPVLYPLIKLGCKKGSFSKYQQCYLRITERMP